MDEKLFLACKEGLIEEVELLISYGSDIHCKDNKGLTVLHHACSNDHIDIVLLLIDKGADVNCKDNKGLTAVSNFFT